MRVIGGKYGGRRLKIPKAVSIKPTQDRVREAVFNILRDKVESSSVLDLFAGSGAFGIEALSRGAEEVLFIEKDGRCISTIKDNLESLAISKGTKIWSMDALAALERLEKAGPKFNLVFCDPPYYKGLAKKFLLTLDLCDILLASALIVLEYHKRDEVAEELVNLTLLRTYSYGEKRISLYNNIKR